MQILKLQTTTGLYHKFIGVTGINEEFLLNLYSYPTLEDLQLNTNLTGSSYVRCEGVNQPRYSCSDAAIAIITCANEWADAEVIEC